MQIGSCPALSFSWCSISSVDRNSHGLTSIPVPGISLKIDGRSHLPSPLFKGSPYIRCRCRPFKTLARDIASMKLDLGGGFPVVEHVPQRTETQTSNPTPDVSGDSDIDMPMSKEWIQEATAVASHFDDVQISSCGKSFFCSSGLQLTIHQPTEKSRPITQTAWTRSREQLSVSGLRPTTFLIDSNLTTI